MPPKLDVIQIDTEGLDDEVIYNSSIDELRPALILYETKRLDHQARRKLHGFLGKPCSWESRGFVLFHGSNDDLAVRVDGDRAASGRVNASKWLRGAGVSALLAVASDLAHTASG